MKKIHKLLFSTIILLLCIASNVKASHVAGGYFQFICTGTPGVYTVRLTLYRDCSGTILGNGPQNINYSSDCGGGGSVNLALVSTTEVSQLCAAELNNSTCNGGNQPGYEEYIYEGTFNLAACNDWNFYYDLCCRNSSNNVSGQPTFYVESNFNTANNNNCTTTPEITAQPEPFVCVNQPVSYNLGASEPDGHTLQYSLVSAGQSPGNNVPYNGGFNGGSPIPGITIDPNTGTVTFTPTNTGAYIVVIQINEFDNNGNLISSTNYDYQTYVINCSNQSPQPPAGGLSNTSGAIVQNGPNSVTFCQNNSGCFDVVFTDANAGDILTVQSNVATVMPGATVNQTGTNPVTMTICWTPTTTSGTVTLNFLVEDDACPLVGITNYAANVNVQNSMSVDLGPDINLACGATTNITSNVTGGSGNYTYMWNDNPAQNGTSLTNVGPGTYWVEVTDNTGNGCNAFDTIVVTQAAPPIPDFTFDQTCDGDAMQFNDNSTAGAAAIVTYEWDFDSDGNIDATGTSPTNTFGAAGNYNVTLTTTDANSCSEDVTVLVTVDPNPVANFDAPTVCFGEQTNFTDQSNIASGNITGWSWDFDDGSPLDANQNPSHTYTNTGNYDVTLTVTSNNTCTNTVTETVSIYTNPSVNFTPTTVCLNTPTVFTDLSSDPSGIANWEWDFDDGSALDVNQNPTHTYSNPGTYNVQLTVTTGNTCQHDTTIQVEVMPLPTADFNFTEVCEYLSTDFTDNSVVVAPSVIQKYYWDIQNDGTTEYITQNANHQYPGYGTYTVELVVETDFGCKDSITHDVDVYPEPLADFSANPLCLGLPTDFTDESTVAGADNIINWTWDFDDGSPLNNTQNPQYQYGSANTFDVNLSVETNHNCVHDTTMSIEIYDLPTSSFTFNNECYNENIQFTEQASANSAQFDWDFGDGNTSTDPNPQHQYAAPGDYTVELTVTTAIGGCTDVFDAVVTAYPIPTPQFTMNNECVQDNVSFTDQSNVIAPSTVNTWDWSFGDGNTATGANPSHLYASEGIYDVKLIIETDHGCKDSLTQQVTVYPMPVVDFTPTDVCLDYATQFTNLSTVSNLYSNNTNDNYLWDFADGNQSTQENPVHMYSTAGIFNVDLTVESNHGCITTATKVVTVHPGPDVTFTGTDLQGCSPLCFNLNSTAAVDNSGNPANPSNIVSYQWNISNGFSTLSSTPNLSECFENNTADPESHDVQLIVTTDKGCVDSLTVNNYIEVYDNPIADFSYLPEQPTIIDPAIDVTNHSTNADTYQWIVQDIGGSSEENPHFEFPPIPNSYKITLTAETIHGCKDDMSTIVQVLDQLLIYVPNVFTPDGDQYNEVFKPILTSGYDPYDYNLVIMNRWGEPVFESNNSDIGWDGTYRGKLAREGVYVWKIVVKDSYFDDRKEFYGHVTLLK